MIAAAILIGALQLHPVPLDHLGQPGLWLPADETEGLLLRLEQLPDLEAYRDAQDLLIDAQTRHVASLRLEISALREVEASQGEELSRALDLAQRQAEAIDSIWRSPWLWLAVGAGLGAAASVAIVYAVHP